ncbi:ATP-binding protein [Sphingomonas sp. CARO-RG-8B-R24-01]|uniref:sensor histidine kinase n=1 Tax=Sphingomonas sp. CARO-RG-8B-R24-01 TaxID=2914831 RepID=UPI001F55CC89|nr:ATP-binding protein [Sphingomonas sp. CARO-RG-8B-R24-01]
MSFAAIKRWRRSSSARFALIFLLLFGAAAIGLFAFVNARALAHFNAQTDEWLARETIRMTPAATRADAIARVDHHNQSDIHHLRPFGLFDPAGRRLAGSPATMPPGKAEDTPFDLQAHTARGAVTLRAMMRRLSNGDHFLVGQDLQESRAFAADLVFAIVWGGLALLLLCLSCAVWLAFLQERRVRRLTESLHQIMAGQLDARLALSPRRDEIDELAGGVNRMLAELERLMLEVKAAGDNIAHDMRTPLTRLLANLRQVDHGRADCAAMAAVISDAVEDVSGMIAMFNALLRISELNEAARRQAFRAIDLAEIVGDATDFHEVAAHERGITIRRVVPAHLAFEGDPDLLFEAVGNLIDNAIKYTPSGGEIVVDLAAGPVLSIADTGPGIPADERAKVLRRFHRVESSRSLPGNGLGLALVSAIAQVHRLELHIGDGKPGCVVSLEAA